MSSYPTQVGNPAPGCVGNPLRLWREVTARQGVALYVHYSGVWDSEAIRQHPDWAALDAHGKSNGNATSFWSPYADRLLIPQLRELAGDYGLDGAWVDGECRAAVPDYSPARAFTDHMAEPVTVPIDFLSGDYSPEDSVNSARLSGPYWVRQGKPWDLMAGSFATRPERRQKPAVQLQREAAVVALGGPFAVTVRLAKAPTKVTLEPAGKVPPFQYRNGEIEIAPPPIAIHEAIVVHGVPLNAPTPGKE